MARARRTNSSDAPASTNESQAGAFSPVGIADAGADGVRLDGLVRVLAIAAAAVLEEAIALVDAAPDITQHEFDAFTEIERMARRLRELAARGRPR